VIFSEDKEWLQEKIIKLGIDLFDCALPTRIARHGQALTSSGGIDLKAGKYKDVFRPIEDGCRCPTCENYTIAQVNFLFRAQEQLAGKILTVHNLFFLETQLQKIRERIELGSF
jgi:queuine tRNA-ribosyltransferase